MKTKQKWKKKTRKIFVLWSSLIYSGCWWLTDSDSSTRLYTKYQTVFGIVANSKNLIGMRTYTYRRSAFINITDRWNVYLCSWLLELIFAINKGN